MDLSWTIQQMSTLGVIGLTWAINVPPRLATATGILVVGYALAESADAGIRKAMDYRPLLDPAHSFHRIVTQT